MMFALWSCAGNSSAELKNELFIIRNFNPLTNYNLTIDGYKNTDSLKHIYMDYTYAMDEGFCIPTVRQLPDGAFVFSFEIKNISAKKQSFYYKLYYQNETYKFPLTIDSSTVAEHPLAYENFYGSWENTNVQFKRTPALASNDDFITITDTFRILGNPRNEQRYFSDKGNNRWQRNPRVGEYSFLLVVASQEQLKEMPLYVKDINKTNNGVFVNPYFYFLKGAGKQLKNTVITQAAQSLKVVAKPDITKGIYINPTHFDSTYAKNYSNTCGQTKELYNSAVFQQFIHYIDATTKTGHIPVIEDVLEDNYSQKDYNWNKQFFTKEELIQTTASTAKYPCESVYADAANKKVVIKNPKTEYGQWVKENVGVITRHGFTYGKHTIKAKMTELLNKNGMWNGLTNAVWLISNSNDPWNARRVCNKEGGYLPNYFDGKDSPRAKTTSYSEIDFEILKTVSYCPDYQFPPVYYNALPNKKNVNDWHLPFPEEIVNHKNDIVVACTNWDMACWEPENYGVGCQPVNYQDKYFEAHRWDHWYKALTEKVYESDDELFASDYYYFQIDWRPTEIIWRIGPSMDKLRVVGYMSDKITNVPNNQMLLIITQEFHNTRWWPGTPFAQDNTPFPRGDIEGEVYELIIE